MASTSGRTALDAACHRQRFTTCSRPIAARHAPGVRAKASAAPQQVAAGPPLLRVPPADLAAGGLDPSKDGPQAKQMFQQHLQNNYLPVNLDFESIRVLNVDPPVMIIPTFMSHAECDALVEAALSSGRMAKSDIGGTNVQGQDHVRTSSTLAVTSEVLAQQPPLRPVLATLLQRARQVIPVVPPATEAQLDGSVKFTRPSAPGQVVFELPQVARYMQGQHFLSHEDAFPVEAARSKGYQRRATLLVYLNDVPTGGCTHFDHLGLSVQPRKGQALLFFPSFANGRNDPRSLHTAQDAQDEKWVTQLWISVGLSTPPATSPQQQPAGARLPPGLQRGGRGGGGGKKRK